MGIDDFSDSGERLAQKFEQLRTRAVEEITQELIKQGDTSIDNARIAAVDFFDDRYATASLIYFTLMRVSESEESPGQEAPENARSIMDELETTFAEGGYMSETIAKRLAAILPDIVDLEDSSWHA